MARSIQNISDLLDPSTEIFLSHFRYETFKKNSDNSPYLPISFLLVITKDESLRIKCHYLNYNNLLEFFKKVYNNGYPKKITFGELMVYMESYDIYFNIP